MLRRPRHRARTQLGQGSSEQTDVVCSVVVRVCVGEEEFELFASQRHAGKGGFSIRSGAQARCAR